MNGGCVIIDCSGVDLGDLGTVTGFYARVRDALKTEKPIVLSGIVNGTQTFTPIVAYGGTESATSVFLSFYPITLHVSSDDEITI